MPSLKIETPPKLEPVTLGLAKRHCRITIDDDDDLLGVYVQGARETSEVFTSRSFINKRYRQCLDAFPYFTETVFSQLAYPPSYYSLPRYSTTLWNYSQMITLSRSPLVHVDRIEYLSSGDSLWHTLLPAPFSWEPSTVYAIGDQIEDTRGNLQEVTASAGDSTSGVTPPGWASQPSSNTQDRALVWTCRGAAPPGDFIYDGEREPPRIFPLPGQNWPSVLYVPNAVRIHYLAGYGEDPREVPGIARIGMLHTIGAWYENREALADIDMKVVPAPVQNLLWGLRVLTLNYTRG